MKSLLVLLSGAVLVLSGCFYGEAKITETQAVEIVLDDHEGPIGKVQLVSVEHAKGRYVVEWENEANCASGKDFVNDQSGEIEMGEMTIC
ncbi:hypothetical protein BN1080_02879 [Planococcus massiliensis]|uniref:Lipoprotein n=1 Tax=Planococcus massiliensis TaxID=1499687 RepID=A0A098EQ23_9BACL|nr:hypothetical protein [Planococcus massiliensis]CEG23872.1 hypothetical protein BN1080_02879 [Planococcus massiliensis]